ncbi:MAG: hypothetical protein CL944_02040 [Candidatus Diapherotrites archaeon]|uniref:Mannose-1-phosphate guanyltransferase C-terminal domain-containing protein n=1 Tax=Candidatus Iainarchaeum sp. TaxID=3101447 RepID=A0A2D6LPY5_9ARCH|nr:hypothetical protein [Candidatus Diapherotrites archaeon]|tara:strand:- start:2605 stop:3198 length:594 start_codon:yes stop_codon:yes gene_type:complete
MIENLIKEAEMRLEKNVPFEFWELIELAEKEMQKLESKTEGYVENGVVVDGNLSLGKGSVVKAGSRIEGNVFVGNNCVIGPNAYLRKGTIIADNCFVGTSEVKNSIILNDSKIPHFSYVGDSVIGRNCNLGAGTKIANLRHDNKSVKVNLNGNKVDSGRRKLGALFFDNVKTGVNSTINCGTILEKDSKVLPNEFRK